jgi:hypothetical protein
LKGREGNPYKLPLALSVEMQKGLDKLKVQFDDANDFPIGLQVLRAGLIIYGVLDEDSLRAMYNRGLIKDAEVMFLLESGLVSKDFRPVKVELLLQAQELDILDRQFGQVIIQWHELKESSKMRHLEDAKKYPMLPNARRLVELVKEEASK